MDEHRYTNLTSSSLQPLPLDKDKDKSEQNLRFHMPKVSYDININDVIKHDYRSFATEIINNGGLSPYNMIELRTNSNDDSYDATLSKDEYAELKPLRRYTNQFLTRKGVITVDSNSKPIDFVDASLICGRFIAASAPPHANFRNWFNLIYDMCDVVVMVTSLEENGRKKASQYLFGKMIKYNDVTVTDEIVEVDRDACIVVSKVMIYRIGSTDIKTIYHIHYTKWSDHNIPNYLEFKKLVDCYHKYRKIQQTNREKELLSKTNIIPLVHCSAGIGRSGTFIAIQLLIEYIITQKTMCDKDNKADVILNIVDLVVVMREYRTGMIQTEEQLGFVYNFVRNYLQQS